MSYHVHMMIAIPPKYSVSQVVGFIKGKSAIHLARVYVEKKRNFVGQHLWARGYFVSTVGRDEAVIREYIRHQEREDKRLEQLPAEMWSGNGSELEIDTMLTTPLTERFAAEVPVAVGAQDLWQTAQGNGGNVAVSRGSGAATGFTTQRRHDCAEKLLNS